MFELGFQIRIKCVELDDGLFFESGIILEEGEEVGLSCSIWSHNGDILFFTREEDLLEGIDEGFSYKHNKILLEV